MQNINSGFNCGLHGSSCTIYSSIGMWKTYRTATFICLHIWPLHVWNIQNWSCLAVDQFLKTTELCQILIKCNLGGRSKPLNKTKRELSLPITAAPLLWANTLTLILTEQISKSIVLTQHGRQLHNINITHKNTSLCTMNHFMELVKIHTHECTTQGQKKSGKYGLHALCESLALISNLTIWCMNFHLKNDKLTYTLQQSVES